MYVYEHRLSANLHGDTAGSSGCAQSPVILPLEDTLIWHFIFGTVYDIAVHGFHSTQPSSACAGQPFVERARACSKTDTHDASRQVIRVVSKVVDNLENEMSFASFEGRFS